MAKVSISKKLSFLFLFICLAVAVSGCSNRTPADSEAEENVMDTEQPEPDIPEPPESNDGFADVTRETRVQDVIDSPVFGEYGRLIFPADRTISSELTLENVGDILTWYTHINPDKTVEIVNYLGKSAAAGDTVFYDIYTEAEKAEDPQKENTGLFFFRGEPDGKVAVCNAGGDFVYVGAMQDSFPHALELSKKGYNAFALIYRPGSQTACEDLARAIASYQTMEERIRQIQAQGTDAEIEVFDGLPHGFGLGEGTAAEGWLDNAVTFWERQMQE